VKVGVVHIHDQNAPGREQAGQVADDPPILFVAELAEALPQAKDAIETPIRQQGRQFPHVPLKDGQIRRMGMTRFFDDGLLDLHAGHFMSSLGQAPSVSTRSTAHIQDWKGRPVVRKEAKNEPDFAISLRRIDLVPERVEPPFRVSGSHGRSFRIAMRCRDASPAMRPSVMRPPKCVGA
jgi:hypothetical protein